jgi:hypothetical protein
VSLLTTDFTSFLLSFFVHFYMLSSFVDPSESATLKPRLVRNTVVRLVLLAVAVLFCSPPLSVYTLSATLKPRQVSNTVV